MMLAGGGAAILLQLAHPTVAAGVARHSSFASAPLGRLEQTLNYVMAAVHGDDSDRIRMRRHVNRRHAHVPGAYDRDPQLWVAATLLWAGERSYERAFGLLRRDDREALRYTFATLGTELQLPAEAWPASVEAFDAWWQAALADARVTDDARLAFARLRHPDVAPWWLRAALPLIWRVALELLPSRLRREFEPAWSRADRFVVELFWAVATPIYRLLPRRMRTWPVRRQLRSLRRA
ncbi:oxygenase MpaB family protein [Gulosibacter sediminis]|uniref:oxygenase MpaB family protein n=1 Tax=Gulosibacter sediminis TaxID=1729695 RepID=UPI0031F6679E